MTSRRKAKTNPSNELRERVLGYFETLRVPLPTDHLDAVLAQAEKQRWSPMEFLERLIGPQADQRRQRAIERRIQNARFREVKTLEGFDWLFNAKAIDRTQIETLATGEFIRRGDNLVVAGQSGVGKSHIVQSVGRVACVLGYRVRYVTSAALLIDLTASLADHSLPQCLRRYSNYELLIIDEFGFDKIERADYLGDAPLAMAILDRLVDGAIVLKIKGRSYRAHRSKQPTTPAAEASPRPKRRRKPAG